MQIKPTGDGFLVYVDAGFGRHGRRMMEVDYGDTLLEAREKGRDRERNLMIEYGACKRCGARRDLCCC